MRYFGRSLQVAAVTALALFTVVSSAAATVYQVNTASDPAGAGCTGGTCSLRQAIEKVNAGTGLGDTVNVPSGHYVLTLGQVNPDKPVAIIGTSGARATIVDGNLNDLVLNFNVTTAPSSLSGVTVTRGSSSGATGVANDGVLTISDSAIVGNVATTSTGGGIYNNTGATMTLNRVTVSGNTAGTVGAGIYNQSNLTIANSTISGNTASTFLSGWNGGGLYTDGPTSITNSTIFGNSANSGGGIDNSGSSPLALRNTIVAGNTATGGTGANCSGDPLTSLGGNLEDLDTCGFALPTDFRNTSAGLGALQNNGGPTDTRALLPGSVAIDHAIGCPPPFTDQRGIVRPQGPACDIGAFEVVVPVADPAKPVASAVTMRPSTFAARGSGGSVIAKKKRKARKGTRIGYKLSEAATTTFTVERATKGRKRGKKCIAKRKRGKRCTTYKLVKGSFTHSGKSGANSLRFSGRIGGKKLRPSKYRLVVTPKDAAGNVGKPARKSFRIVR